MNRGLPVHISGQMLLSTRGGLDRNALKELFHMLMVMNPSIEVYLLDKSGGIETHLAPEGHLKRGHIDLVPVRQFLASSDSNESLPIFGDDPRSETQAKIFSAAALIRNGKVDRYLYVIFAGEAYQQLASNLWNGRGASML